MQVLRDCLSFLAGPTLVAAPLVALLTFGCGTNEGSDGKSDARADEYCDALTPCTEPGLRYCDIAGEYPASNGNPNTCIPDPRQTSCSASMPCTSGDTPHCTSGGECVACLNFSHCTAQTPVCSLTTHTCGACREGDEGDQICAAIDPLQPFCSQTGSCVECLDNTSCEIASSPICDGTAFSCRACQAGECEAGTCNLVSGVCDPST